MAKIKITREELKHDEVLESADVAVHWIRDNIKFILGTIVVALAIYALVGTFHSRRQESLAEANDLLAEALDKYSEAMQAHQWATPERQSAMKEVAALAQNVVEKYPDTSLALQALLLQGNAYYSAGDDIASSREGAPNTNEAINAYTRYVAEAKTPFDIAKGKLALAGAYENMFFLVARPDNPTTFQQDARRTYEEVAEDEQAPPFMRAEALLALGRLFAFQNQPAEAEKYYRQVMDLRYKPLEPISEETAVATNRAFVRQLDQQAQLFSLVGTARLELQRLGIDVEKEYPLVKKAEEASEEASAEG